MPVSNLEFGATVSKWVKQSEARMTAVWRESMKRIVSIAQEGPPHGIPVDTGFARASIVASLTEMPVGDQRPPPGRAIHSYNPGPVVVVLASARLGDTVYIGWTANYAIYLEYGHSQQAPSGFVRIAAMQWQRVVREVSRELRNRVEGGG